MVCCLEPLSTQCTNLITDLIHFCWREREASLDAPEVDLIMVPTDGYLKPYLGEEKLANTSPINGRVFVLKFRSSSERKFFWLQSREQPAGQKKTFSSRDMRMAKIVDNILQGNEIDGSNEASAEQYGDDNDDDDDQAMEDVQETTHFLDHNRSGSGGAGPDATGGDVNEEGHESREGGADGGRA
jgi:26S proteasome regulatory subunit N13